VIDAEVKKAPSVHAGVQANRKLKYL